MERTPQQALIADMKRVLYVAGALILLGQIVSGWPTRGKR